MKNDPLSSVSLEDTSRWEQPSYLLFFNYVASLCICACECSAQGCQKRALDPLELELQDVELWMPGTERGSSSSLRCLSNP